MFFSPFLYFKSSGWVSPGRNDRKIDAKRAQAEACALNLSVIKSAHESPGSETSTVFVFKLNHIQHEAHSFLFCIFCIIASKFFLVKWAMLFCPKEGRKEKVYIFGFICMTILKNNLERKSFSDSMIRCIKSKSQDNENNRASREDRPGFRLFHVFCPVFAGREAGIALEHPGEMALGRKTQEITDSSQRFVGIAEQTLCFTNFLFQNKVGQAFACFCNEFSG